MLISPAPIAIPVNTANIPTEALATEAVTRPKIPQPTSATENTANKNTTEFAEQNKPNLENALQNEKGTSVNEREQGAQEKNSNENQEQAADQRNEQELDSEQLAQVRQLQSRDREVRAHEQAHAAAGGSLTGAPSLNFTTGPDGRRYAVSGEVSIDVSAVSGDPAATIRKLEQVQRAALAPANPSSQDRSVASSAATSINQARSELNVERLSENEEARVGNIEQSNETDYSGSVVNVSSEHLSSAPPQESVDPVQGRRLAENLALRIIGSGAFAADEIGGNLSIRA